MSAYSFKAVKRSICMLAALVAFTGCSAEAWKRAAYETSENMKQQQCAEQLGSECSQRDSYEEYQRNRGDVFKTEQSSEVGPI